MLIDDLKQLKECCWKNPNYKDFDTAIRDCELTLADIEDASSRLE